MIDPWTLFGVTPETPMRDVRKAYLKMALLCHPDHGGNTSDMNIVYQAYVWIRDQIESADRRNAVFRVEERFRTLSMNEIEKEVANFNEEEFNRLYDAGASGSETHASIKDFVKGFVIRDMITNSDTPMAELIERNRLGACQKYPSSIEGGYGEFLAKTETTPLASLGKQEIIEYREPECAIVGAIPNIELPHMLEDFSVLDQKLYDYAQAFKEPGEFAAEFVSDTSESLEERLAEMQENRDAIDKRLRKSTVLLC